MNTAIGKRVSYDQGCLKSVRKLPDYVSGKFLDVMSRYMDSPTSNGLRLKPIQGSKDKSLKSMRLDDNYRAVAFETAKDIMFIHVNEHDKAYRWAEGRKVVLDAATNRIRVVEEVEQTQVEVNNDESKPSLFSSFKDKKLIALGVAEAAISIARTIFTEEELDEAEERFDPLSFQVLYGLAAGYSEEEVYAITGALVDEPADNDNTTFEKLVDTEESKQTIFTPQNIEELRRFFDGELEGWRVWLHPEQRKLAYKDYNGPAMVRGGAGTGKTVVAMHRAKYLADKLAQDPTQKGQKVLITTFTRTLATDIATNLKTLCPEHLSGTNPRIEVANLDSWASQYLKKKQFDRQIVSSKKDEELIKDLWNEACDAFVLPEGISQSYAKSEWEQIIQAKGIDDLNTYIRTSRAGRGTPLNRAKRKQLWNIFSAYRAKLINAGLAERDDVYIEAIPLLKQDAGSLGYAAVIVDEAQDMGEQAFKLIRELVPITVNNDKNTLFIVGDAHQRIYARKASMSSCGINIVGRSRRLKLNYRTTHEIRKWAVAILQGVNVDDLDAGEDSLDGYISVEKGVAPQLSQHSSDKEELDALAQWITELTNEMKDSDIGILAFTNKQLEDLENYLEAKGIASYRLSPNKTDDSAEAGVRLCTMHRAKGLEFKAVALPFISASKFPPQWKLSDAVDDADREDIEAQLKSLLHVAATRAKGHLRVSWAGEKSPFIQ